MSRQAGRDRRLDELLGHYVEQRVLHGVAPDPEELCRDAPELLEPLREHVREYHRLERSLAPAEELAPGRFLRHFRIVEKLGQGGMGQVYAAEDTRLGGRVALKLLPPEMAEHPERLSRFRREARAVAALSHPNIVTVHSVEEYDGIHFLVMELVSGTTLRRAISSGGMPVDQVLQVGAGVAAALAAAHDRGITHRDLKPENVMVDGEGRVKVLDFGLAKWSPEPAAGESSQTLTETLTEDGRILGTLPYMAPEQILGEPVDARTDLYALGVLLYELASGRRPFQKTHPAELVSAILRDVPEPLRAARGDLPERLAEVVDRCLKKEPGERFASARALRDALSRVAAEPEGAAASRRGGRPDAWLGGRPSWAAAGLALALGISIVGAAWLREAPAPDPAVQERAGVTAPRERPKVAVLAFDNLNGEADLEWLRHGLSQLMVVHLSRSSEIDVLSPGRVDEVLGELGLNDGARLSFEAVRGVASAVMRGSFARAGARLRVVLTVEDPASGSILRSEQVDGRGVEGLFTMVDTLGAAVRDHFALPGDPEPVPGVQAVTTASIDAWRLYTEGNLLNRRGKREEAIVLLERAIELDPGFALAHADLATIHANLGHAALARRHVQRALELSDHLPRDQRFRIEAGDYGARWSTLDRAIDAYEEALELDPGVQSLRHNLARRYAFLERFDEALDELETLIAAGTEFRGTAVAAANVYAHLGRFETGYQVLSSFVRDHPGDWIARLGLGWHLTEWGRLDEAAEALERIARDRPGEPFVHYARWRVEVLRRDWRRAEVEARALAALDDDFARWRGEVSRARLALFHGRSEEALEHLERASRSSSEQDAFAALAQCFRAELLLQRGEAERALAAARQARRQGAEQWPELLGAFCAALAEQQLGHPGQADELVASLRQRWREHPNRVEERQLAHLEGLLALARGDAEGAVRLLGRAVELLPPRGFDLHWHLYPQHVAIWSALGHAELAAGRPELAAGWYRRVAESGSEHLEQPVPYVRAFGALGTIQAQSGEATEARRHLERFLAHWRRGDLDREQVARAESLLRPGRLDGAE